MIMLVESISQLLTQRLFFFRTCNRQVIDDTYTDTNTETDKDTDPDTDTEKYIDTYWYILLNKRKGRVP